MTAADMTLDQAIQALYDFRTRPQAIRTILRRYQREAAPKLIPLLDDTDPAIVWCAVRLLGDVGNQDAVPKMMEKKDDPEFAGATIEALRKLGVTVEQESNLPVATAIGHEELQAGDAETLFKTAQMIPGAIAERTENGFRATMRDGEHEFTAHATLAVDETSEIRLTMLCDTGLPAEPKHYKKALELNAHLDGDCVAVVPVDGAERLVILHPPLGQMLDPQVLRAALHSLVRAASRVVAELQG